jgi:hypothetical protein
MPYTLLGRVIVKNRITEVENLAPFSFSGIVSEKPSNRVVGGALICTHEANGWHLFGGTFLNLCPVRPSL